MGYLLKPVRKIVDSQGHVHAPAGSPQGGEFIHNPNSLTPAKDLDRYRTTVDGDTFSMKGAAARMLGHDTPAYHEYIAEQERLLNEEDTYEPRPAEVEEADAVRILDKLFKDVAKYKPKPGVAPEVIIMAGRGGAGKSNFKKEVQPTTGIYSEHTHLTIDPDDLMKQLSGYTPDQAARYHAEAGRLFERAYLHAVTLNLNTALDVTMRSNPKWMIDIAKQTGYTVHGAYMHSTPNEALIGQISRWKAGETIQGVRHTRGRVLPYKLVAHQSTIPEMFDQHQNSFDHTTIQSNDQFDENLRRLPPRVIMQKIDKLQRIFKLDKSVESGIMYLLNTPRRV